MKAKFFFRASLCTVLASVSLAVAAAPPPRIAVADLVYEDRISDIDRGEFRKFTSNIKNSIQKSGRFELIHGRPSADPRSNENINATIGRIKNGMYPGADYVLFGRINSIEFRQETNPIDNTNTVSHTLNLELVGEFSLINTKTLKIKSSFSAPGAGADVKMLTSRGGNVVLNRNKVISETGKSLGDEVARQLEEELTGGYSGTDNSADRGGSNLRPDPAREEVIIFK